MENIKKLIETLNKRGFIAKLFDNESEAIAEIEKNLERNEQIGFGGSMTIRDMKLPETLIADGFKVFFETDGGDYLETAYKNRLADVYFSSVNALTENGELMNVDGTGNRLAGTLFGAKKMFYVLGVNKIVKDFNCGVQRIRNVAAPLNAKRLNKNTPCVITGKCMDCDSPDRICRAYLTVNRPLKGKDTYIYIINKNLGF